MSMPSDTNADVAEAVGAIEAEAARAVDRPGADAGRADPGGSDAIGLAAAALFAFVGIALVGPAITRLLRPSLGARMADRAAVTRYRIAAGRAGAARRGRRAGKRAAKALRRLGGGTIRR